MAALDLSRQTAEATRSSHVLAGLAMLHAAEAYAMMQRQECERALGEGEALFERMSTTDAAIDLFSPSDYSRMAGSCYLFLGDAPRAQSALEITVREVRDGSKAQVIALGNLGLAHLRQRQFEEAAATLHRAVDVVERTRGGGGLTVVFTAGRELQPWYELAAVRDVHDRLLSLVAG